MKQKLVYTSGLIVFVVAMLAAIPAAAQTVSNGPYYATPSWDQTLPAATRWIILSNFASAAVLDRNTGLVWEKSPTTNTTDWSAARSNCLNKNVGGQKGWRLPSVVELASLIDPLVPSPGPMLQVGHPFLVNIEQAFYWAGTTLADFPTLAWRVNFNNGLVNVAPKTISDSNRAWCVRGAMQESVH